MTFIHSAKCGPLSPRHGTFSYCGWSRQPPDVKILSKQSWRADKGWSSLGVGRGAKNSSP